MTVEPVFAWISGNLPGSKRHGGEGPRERGRKEAGPARQPPGASRSAPHRPRPGTEWNAPSGFRLPLRKGVSRRAGDAQVPRLNMWSSGHPMALCQQGGLGTGQRWGTVRGHLGRARRVWGGHSSSSWSPEGVTPLRGSREGLAGCACHELNPGAQRGLRSSPIAAWRLGGASHSMPVSPTQIKHSKRAHGHSEITKLEKITHRLNEWTKVLKIWTGWNDGQQWVRWNLIKEGDGLTGFLGWMNHQEEWTFIWRKQIMTREYLISNSFSWGAAQRHQSTHSTALSANVLSRAVPPPDTNSLASVLPPGSEQEWLVGRALRAFALKTLKHRYAGFPADSAIKNLPATQETGVRSLGWEDPLEEDMETHSSVLAWRIPWAKELGRFQSIGLQRVGCDWSRKIKRIPQWTPTALSPRFELLTYCHVWCMCLCVCLPQTFESNSKHISIHHMITRHDHIDN